LLPSVCSLSWWVKAHPAKIFRSKPEVDFRKSTVQKIFKKSTHHFTVMENDGYRKFFRQLYRRDDFDNLPAGDAGIGRMNDHFTFFFAHE
jgi:hypothetical protein